MRKEGIDIAELIVRQVSELVRATADVLAADGAMEETLSVLQWEARLYRSLEVNCAAKREMAEAFAGQLSNTEAEAEPDLEATIAMFREKDAREEQQRREKAER
jgi:hypothetical protein